MTTWLRATLGLLVGVGLGILATTAASPRTLRAVDDPPATRVPAVSLQDALHRPIDLVFEKPTKLSDVQATLARQLNVQVFLDLAAIDRLKLTPDATVQITLKGVRLKTSLRLLLDQVGMTYKVEPEDNLLILTDTQGVDDTNARVFNELKAMHREIHDLQDTLDELITAFEAEEPVAEIRNPTIIEELPGPEKKGQESEKGKEKPKTKESTPSTDASPTPTDAPRLDTLPDPEKGKPKSRSRDTPRDPRVHPRPGA